MFEVQDKHLPPTLTLSPQKISDFSGTPLPHEGEGGFIPAFREHLQHPLNVLQLISSLEAGGIEKLLVDLVEACQEDKRIQLTVAVMNQSINPTLKERLERTGISIYYLNRPEGHKHPRYLMELQKIIHRHHIEVVHVHQSGSKFWGMLCKLLNPEIKLIMTIHDTMAVPRLSPLQLWIQRHWVDQHIAISKTVNAICQDRGIDRCKPIYNGISIESFRQPDRPSWPQRLAQASFAEKPLQIVHVGRLDYSIKGQDILIDAIALCGEAGLNVHCRLMGGVYAYNQKAFEDLQAQVRKLKLENHVEFLVNRTDVPDVLKDAELFVMPSRFEGLGIALLEAMAAGLPVIASNTEGPSELVEEGMTGFLFETGVANDLFRCIKMVYEMPESAELVRQNALRWVAAFDIQTMKNQYYEIWSNQGFQEGNTKAKTESRSLLK